MAIALQGHLAAISHLFPNLASAASPVLLRHSDAQHLARTLRKRILAREATPGEIYAGLALLQGLGRPEDIQSIEEYLAQGDDAKRSVAVRNSIAHMDQWSLAARRNPAASRIFLEELALAKKTLTQRRAGILDMEQLETDLGKLFDGTLARGARMEDSPAFAGNAAESRLPASGLKPYAPNSGAQRPAHGKIPFPTAAPILDLLNPSSFAAPENPLPGSQFTIMALMDLVEGSANYADYIRKLTTRFRVNSKGAFFALHGDRTVTPETPQLFLTIGNATIAYAPQMYTEIFWSEGDDTIQFQITEEPGGKLLINAYKFIFGQSGRMFKAKPEHVLTPEQVRRMHASELVGRTNKFAQEACASCHMNPRRRMVEPQNHTRRFVEDINWKFRDPAQHQLVKRKLASLFDRFANGPTRNNPLYRWLWEQPAVAARGGQIRPEDTFNYSQFISRMIETNSREMLAELKRSPRWGEYGEAFAAVVQYAPDVDHVFRKLGFSDQSLAAERMRIRKLHAELNLAHIRHRNDEAIAWILGEGDHELVPRFENNDFLLLNRHAIETIGPGILGMIVGDQRWAGLAPAERRKKVRLSELDIGNFDDLTAMMATPRIQLWSQRRTNAHIVLERMLNNRNKALLYLSASVLSLSAETGCEEACALDEYNKLLNGSKHYPLTTF